MNAVHRRRWARVLAIPDEPPASGAPLRAEIIAFLDYLDELHNREGRLHKAFNKARAAEMDGLDESGASELIVKIFDGIDSALGGYLLVSARERVCATDFPS